MHALIYHAECQYSGALRNLERFCNSKVYAGVMFDYNKAFSRNIGWITTEELTALRAKKVAIAGAGGVGGEHLITLTRLGIGRFSIADFDVFEVHNFNRQAGAFMSTIDQPKIDVMARMAQDINPELDLTVFDEGINETNIDAFLDGVDLYVDSLDFFALDARKLVFTKCTEKKIPIITAAPVAMGCAFLCFMPGQMTPEEYFRLNDAKTEDDAFIRFLIGLSPAMLQQNCLVDETAMNFVARKAPSTPMGIKLCAGIAGSYALKILLGRGQGCVAPHGLHFDAYKNKFKKTWRPWGNRNPLQKLLFKMVQSKLPK